MGGVNFSEEKRYEGVRFNVISVTRGWVGVQIPGKKHYVTLEWPLISYSHTPPPQISDQSRGREQSHSQPVTLLIVTGGGGGAEWVRALA